MKEIDEVLENIENTVCPKTLMAFNSIEHGIQLLEKSRSIKEELEGLCGEISKHLLFMFENKKIKEYGYKDLMVKPGLVTKYDCSKLAEHLAENTKLDLAQFQKIDLNKSIIEKGIENGILEANNIDEYIEAGLISKKTRKFIRFSKASKEPTDQ